MLWSWEQFCDVLNGSLSAVDLHQIGFISAWGYMVHLHKSEPLTLRLFGTMTEV